MELRHTFSDAVDAITSNAGWDAITHQVFLTDIVTEFKFTLKPGVDVKQLTHMTLKPKDGLALILESIGSE